MKTVREASPVALPTRALGPGPCVCDVALSGWCKSSSKEVTTFVAEGNCVAAMRGGEQPEANE